MTDQPECNHYALPALTYVAAHEDAQRRMADGEKQRRCRVCGLWVWTSLWRPDRKREWQDERRSDA